MLEQVPPEGLQPIEGPTLEQGKAVRRKELQRGAVTNSHSPHPPAPLRDGRQRSHEGWCEIEPGNKGRGEGVVLISKKISVSHLF